MGHIALNCGDDYDVRQLMSRLKRLGVPYRENVSVPNPATKKQVIQAFVRDPDGHYLEFCSCESLEEFIQEKSNLQKSLLNFKRMKATMTARTRIIEWLNLDQTQANEKYKQSLKKWGKARAIKQYGSEYCQEVSEAMIASIASKFKSIPSILSIIKERHSSSLFQNILKNNNTEHFTLLFAAGLGDIGALKKGVQEGLDINYVDTCSRTCLHVAADNGHLDCVIFLVKECLVDPTVEDFRGFTPLECAKKRNYKDVVNFLQETESAFKISDHTELTNAELEEVKTGILDWVEKIEEAVVVDDAKFTNLSNRQKTYGDILQNTTKEEIKFFLGIFNNHVPAVIMAVREKIMAKGRQLFFPPAFYERNQDFRSPQPFSMKVDSLGTDTFNLADTIHAARFGILTTLKSAHESGIDLNRRDYDQKTALHHSCAGAHMDCVQFLVEVAMVSVGPKDIWSMTPLDYARANDNMDILQFLQEKGTKHHLGNNETFSPTFVESKDKEKMVEKFFT